MARRRNSALDHPVSSKEVVAAATVHEEYGRATSAEAETRGLPLSPIKYVSIKELTPSSYNAVFETVKGDAYWAELESDIRDADVIIEPLVATKDNVLLSGHSRLSIARKLFDEGNPKFAEVPVRYVQKELSENDRKQRVYLSNLNRFEIDQDTRIRLRAELYPDFYNGADRKSGPKPGTTGAETREWADTAPGAKEIAASNNMSKRSAERERVLHRKAVSIAGRQGRSEPTKDDYQKARKSLNTTRSKNMKTGTRSRSYSEKTIRTALVTFETICASEEHKAGAQRFVEILLGAQTT